MWPECDRQSRVISDDDNRIIGGQESQSGKWPFLIKFNIGCGGSIINNNWVITAAHCCKSSNSFEIMQKNLAANICKLKLKDCTRNILPESVHIHPKYDVQNDYDYDFCLVEYPEDSFKDEAKICISTTKLDVGEWCFIAGWGVITKGF